jgi:NADH-quinone oxidoreductase subunit M
VFNAKLPIAVVASLGVVGAAAYALRAFIMSMHNRVGARVNSFDISIGDALPVIGLLVVIIVLAFYPQFGLRRSERTVRAAVAPAQAQQIAQASAHKVAQAP